MSIDAMKQALEALEGLRDLFYQNTIEALRAAIEAAEKCEPVAQGCSDGSIEWYRPSTKPFVGPLYTHPAPIPEGWQMVPKEPTPEMIDQGARGMASFGTDSIWPDSWDKLQVRGMRHDASKAWRYMLAAAPEYKP